MSVDRALLPHTFGNWFTRFAELTQVQREAIPIIMSGRDALLCSATASGKTEAYAAPAAELVLREDVEGTAALIIAPTRALTNDLKRRLEGLMGLTHVSFGRYTGEHKEKVDGRLPSVVVATPEAVDSLIARRPGMLRDVRMVVLDEIHVLDSTLRGDQLRILLNRLEGVTNQRPQRVAASATVDRPEELALRYLKDPEVVVVPGLRRILGRVFHGRGIEFMVEHLDDLAKNKLKKVLVFCRSRNQVENLTSKLRNKSRFGDAVFAHHGSMAKNQRERTERLFHQAPAAVAVATMTLEMGIDIGTVDYILLFDVPADVSSLLQRMGRGGRRGDSTRCGYVVQDKSDVHLFETMFHLGKAGILCGAPYGFRPSVLVQQALVMACSQAYITLADVEGMVPVDIMQELGANSAASLLDQMVASDLLERAGADRFVATEEIETRYNRGSLHGNIADGPSVSVVDRMTGDIIGRIQSADTQKIEVAGMNRHIVKGAGERILTDAAGAGAAPARFRSSASPSTSFLLGRAVVTGLMGGGAGKGLAPHEQDGQLIYALDQGPHTMLVHGLGTVGSLLFAHQVGRKARVVENNAYCTTITGGLVELPRPTGVQVQSFVKERIADLAKLASAGPWERGVPSSMREEAVRRICGVDQVAAFMQIARLVEVKVPDPEVLDVIGGF